MSKLLK